MATSMDSHKGQLILMTLMLMTLYLRVFYKCTLDEGIQLLQGCVEGLGLPLQLLSNFKNFRLAVPDIALLCLYTLHRCLYHEVLW